MAQGTPKEKLWNPNIQALRGLSISLVLICHFFGKPGQFGTLGVGIFFCISGYLITNLLIQEFNKKQRISIPNFYKRRAKRLLPLAYLVIFIVVVIAVLTQLFPSALSPLTPSTSYGGLRRYLLSAAFSIFYVGNLFGLAHLGYADLATSLGHFWSLAVEEQFYFFWPLLLWLILKKWSRHLSLICVLGILTTPAIHFVLDHAHKTSWTLPTSYLDLFFFGALLTIHKEKVRQFGHSRFLILIGIIAVTLIIALGVHIENFSSQGYLVFSLTEVLLFVGLLNWKPFGEIWILRKLGDWSYALYCIHWPIIVLFSNIGINSILKKVITITLSFALAALSTKYFETLFWKPSYLEPIKSDKNVDTPVISLKQRLINRARVSELVATTRFSINLLHDREKMALLWLVFLQIALGLIDLAGVFLLGVITTRFWSSHGSGGVGLSPTLTNLLKLFHLNNLSLIKLSAFACVLFTLKALLSTLNSRRMYSHLATFTSKISQDFIQYYLNTPYVLLRKLNEQKFYFAFTDGLNSLIIGVLGSLTLLISDGFMLIILFTALCFVNLTATIAMAFFFSALALFLVRRIAPKVKSIGNSLGALSNRSRESLLDLREMYPTIRKQEQMKYLTNKISGFRSESSTVFSKGEWLSPVPKNILEISAILGVFLMIIYASTSAGKSVSVALISVFFAASARIVPAIIRLQGNWLAFNRSVGYSQEGMEMYRLVKSQGRTAPQDQRELTPGNRGGGSDIAIAFRDVSFRYPDVSADSIFRANFEIYKGEKVAIVGDSGAGKTTLANLILGLYKPVDGEVERGLVDDGNTVARYGYLPQVPHIISGTLLENVVLTDKSEEVDIEKFQKVLKDAHISDFIDSLPDKFDTLLGPRGVSLSGGQRQRIALARVLYSNQDVVVLDEPTSSLDAETDEIVSDMLLHKLEDKTVIIVAHRYSTIREVDRILYLHAGEIVCFDTWEVVRRTVPKFALQASLQGFDS